MWPENHHLQYNGLGPDIDDSQGRGSLGVRPEAVLQAKNAPKRAKPLKKHGLRCTKSHLRFDGAKIL